MADATNDFSSIWKTQKSLTEWLEDIRHADTERLREEDNDKRERLAELHRIIGLPFDQPVQFAADELANSSDNFQTYLRNHGDELCALRLIPRKANLPKLRMRGKTVREAYEWFQAQDIDPKDYRADFLGQERQSRWATIFIVNRHGIQGEILYGKHFQLTQGFHETDKPKIFYYDFKKWEMVPTDDEALAHVKQLAAYVRVPDAEQQAQVAKKLGGTFTHDYLEGYFETVDSVDFGTWFIDYNQTLAKLSESTVIRGKTHTGSNEALVSGQTGCVGEATGPVRIISPDNIDVEVPEGFVLVCSVTTPQYVPLMQKAAAIVTDQGGILSHAAIVARELKKPCIVGTGNATHLLQNDRVVHVDATNGIVKLQA